MKNLSLFFLLSFVIVCVVFATASLISAAAISPLHSLRSRKNGNNSINNVRSVAVKHLPKNLKEGPGAPGLAYSLQESFNTRNITLLQSIVAPNASFFISSWGPARVDATTFIAGIAGYFQETTVVQEDLFLRIVHQDFVLGERMGTDILKGISQFSNTSSNPWFDFFFGDFRLVACNGGSQISTLDTFSGDSNQGNATLSRQVVQNALDALQSLDAQKALSFFAKDGEFNLFPANGLPSPCTGSCIAMVLQQLIDSVSNGRFKIAVLGMNVIYNFVFVRRTDSMVALGEVASIVFEDDVVELDASYKIKKWNWYYMDPSIPSAQTPSTEIPAVLATLNNFIRAQETLNFASLSNLIADDARIFNWRAGFAPIGKSEALQLWKSQMEQVNQIVYSPKITMLDREVGFACGVMSVFSVQNIALNESLGWDVFWEDNFCMYVNATSQQIVEYGAFCSPDFPYPQGNATQSMQVLNNLYNGLLTLNVDMILSLLSDDFVFRQVPNKQLPNPCNAQCLAQFLQSTIVKMTYHGLIWPYSLGMQVSYNHVIGLRKNFFVFTPPGASSGPVAKIGDATDIIRLDGNYKIQYWENLEGSNF